MRKYLFLLVFVLSYPLTVTADDWGKTGHRVVGEIAQKYLSEKTAMAVSDLLDGHTLAFVANFGDDIKSDRKYDEYGPWHYVNFPFGREYDSYPKSEEGDIIRGIETCVEVLKNEKSSREDKVFHLKMLIHFIGDLHQPLHVGMAEDRGGNQFQVQWFNKGTNLHSVWDEKIIDSYLMSYTEIASNADVLSQQQLREIQSGTVIDWMNDSRELCEDIYENTEVGERLWYPYMYRYVDPVRTQLQKGGIRLAVILNEIFG